MVFTVWPKNVRFLTSICCHAHSHESTLMPTMDPESAPISATDEVMSISNQTCVLSAPKLFTSTNQELKLPASKPEDLLFCSLSRVLSYATLCVPCHKPCLLRCVLVNQITTRPGRHSPIYTCCFNLSHLRTFDHFSDFFEGRVV